MIDAGRADSKYKDLSVTVEHGEIGYDDGDGQRNGQDPGQGAQGTDEHAGVCLGYHVSVAYCCHGYYGPPKSFGDALKSAKLVESVAQKPHKVKLMDSLQCGNALLLSLSFPSIFRLDMLYHSHF